MGPPNAGPGRIHCVTWNWKKLGEEVEAARRACVPHWVPGHKEAAERFHRAVENAWPPDFFTQLERCRRGEKEALNDILDFIEACPHFFRSGYVLDKALRFVVRPPRSSTQDARLRQVVLKAVRLELRLPFRNIGKVARAVNSPELRSELASVASEARPTIRDRALSVLDGLSGKPWDVERSLQRRRDDRAVAMAVTAFNRRSPHLLRRTLSLDPCTLTSRGRSALAATFELAMNWDLLPKEELLVIAKNLQGPEMEPIWSFALRRTDGPGDRARWLQAHLRNQ